VYEEHHDRVVTNFQEVGTVLTALLAVALSVLDDVSDCESLTMTRVHDELCRLNLREGIVLSVCG
jgi:hypothetical protein